MNAVAHALDVTASRLEQSFHALESSRSELTALLDSMQEAVIAINPQGQVSWCNAVMQRIAVSPVQSGRALVHSIRDPEVLSSVAAALTAIHRGMDAAIDDGLAIEEAAFARIVPSCDAREGVAAFLERRRPSYLGR